MFAMAEVRRNSISRFMLGALCLGACAVACAQPSPAHTPAPRSVQVHSPPSGALAGRLTDLHSAPLAGVIVVLRNRATGTEVHATTAKNGDFRFASLEAGEYTLDADAPRLGHGRIEGIHVTGGMEARVQAAVRFTSAAPALLEADSPAVASHPALETSNPLLAASVAPAPLSTMRSLTLHEPDKPHPPAQAVLVQPTSQPVVASQTSPGKTIPAVVPTQARSAELIHATRATVAQPGAELQTEPPTTQLALAVRLPRLFPLTPSITPALPDGAALANAVAALLQLVQPVLMPVAAAAQRTDPATPAVSTTMTAAELQALPASGRRWQDFLLDTPAASTAEDSPQTSFRASQESAEFTIDGASTRLAFGVAAGSDSSSQAADPASQSGDPTSAMSGPGSQAWAGGRGLSVSEAAVHEVTTVAGNVEAEGSRSAGGGTSIQTEGGSGALHGQGSFFDRQNTWGAQNPFTQWLENTGMAPTPGQTPIIPSEPVFSPIPSTPPDHEMVWGLGAGSSIRRNKLFWFAAIDSYHRNDPGLATAKNPITTDQYGDCAGFFCPPSDAQVALLGAQLGESENQAASDYFGLPNSGNAAAGLEQLAALLGPAPRAAAQWTGFARIDWQAAEHHRFTLESIGADWSAPGGGLTRLSENDGSHSFGSSHASQEWLLARWEAYLTPNLLAVTQASGGRDILAARPDTPSAFEQGFLSVNAYGQLPQIVVDSANGFTIGNPSRFGQGSYPDEKLYHGQEMLDWVRNHLLIKAGIEFDHNADATSLLRNQTGTYSYSHVANFISDALAFERFGFADTLDPRNPHNCGATNTTFGSQPCYSYYSQTMGPTNWNLSTNDWASYATAQWQLNRIAVFSAGLRWELEQMPPPLANLNNPDLPLTQKLPSLGSDWGPRISLAIGDGKGRWPVLRLGYGMYYGRTENATIETALTQTGSLKGDLNFFLRPSDDCQYCAGGAPPFPYVFQGQPASVVKPGAVEFASNFRNPEVHQAVASLEQPLPGRMLITASALLSLGRRLPVFIDTNFDPAVNPGTITYNVCDETPTGTNNTKCGQLGLGPIKTTQITVPFYASWPSTFCPSGSQLNAASQCGWLNPNYQQVSEMMSRANSTYEAAMVKLTRYGRRGLSLHAHYTYAHAMDWNPDESPLDPADFSQEYGTSNLDVRHSAAAMVIYEAPWKLRGFAGRIGNGWMLSSIGQFHSGLPYTMRTSGSLPEEFTTNGAAIAGLGPGMNGSGGDNRVFGVGRNTFRYPETWKADLRLGKRFDFGDMRELEILAESYNLFNHQNVTELETSGYSIEPGSASSPLPTLRISSPASKSTPRPAFPPPHSASRSTSTAPTSIASARSSSGCA